MTFRIYIIRIVIRYELLSLHFHHVESGYLRNLFRLSQALETCIRDAHEEIASTPKGETSCQ